jgi:hypothetical protein
MFLFLLLALQDWTNDKGEWTPPEYPISYWVGPPGNFTTLERYKEIAEAGFNIAMPPFDWGDVDRVKTNLQILDFCKEAGLKTLIQDKRMWGAVHGKAFKAEQVDAAIADYSKHPAFLGFYLRDEPGADLFPRLGQTVSYLREKDPKHPAFINLFPNYASAQQLGTPTYKEHVEKYIQTVRPFVICYDHYHLYKNGTDGGQFYSNMELVRKASLESKIPWWQTVISCGLGNMYRDPTEAEMRYIAMQTLVYGAKGLMWFTYWQHAKGGPEFLPAIIDKDGNRTKHFEEVKRINAKVKAIGKFLLTANSELVYHKQKEGVPVRVEGKVDLTIGIFRAPDARYVLITNRDYKAAVKATYQSERPLQRLVDGQWVRADKTFELAPGGGELFRFE